jgi:uncharacterized protein (TIGR02217 family)
MADFLEERLSDLIRFGSTWAEDYEVNIVTTSGGQEYRSMPHPFPVRRFDISYLLTRDDLRTTLLATYQRAHGRFAGFRARCYDEWSSNGATGTPTATDQPMLAVTAGATYQLVKQYGTDKAAGATGYPYRKIRKPVSGTVLVSIGTTAIRSADWSVDTTTGIVTFAADVTASVSSIGQSNPAVLTVGAHSFVTGMAVHISGVSGMTQINGQRALVTAYDATHITVAINSSAFSTYTSGGVVHTRPQTGEVPAAGFEFDFPVRFNSSLPIGQEHPNHRTAEAELIEILNP